MTQSMKAYLLVASLAVGIHGFGGAFGWFKGVNPVGSLTRGARTGYGGAFRGGK